MTRILATTMLMVVLGAGSAQAGYVRTWLDAKGGCANGPGVLQSLDIFISPGSQSSFLGKKSAEWTDADFDEYRLIYTECVQRWPNFLTPGASPARVASYIEDRMANVQRYVIDKYRAEAHAGQAAEQAKIEARNTVAAEQRARVLAEAKADLARADAAVKQAEIEAPLIAEADRQADAALRARKAAEEQLEAVRSRLAVKQQQAKAEEAKRQAALSEQATIEQREHDRQEDASFSKTCDPTAEQFAKVRIGMSLRQVRRSFGCLGAVESEQRIVGIGTMTTYTFSAASGIAVALVTFRGTTLETKSQIGLQ